MGATASTHGSKEVLTKAAPAGYPAWPPARWESDSAKQLEVTPLPETDLDGVMVGEHQLLGITEAAMLQFMRRIDFPFWFVAIDGVPHQHDGHYVRDENELGYVTSLCGPVQYFKAGDRCTQPRGVDDDVHSRPYGFRVGAVDPRSLTGYDLAYTIRKWLQAMNKTG